MTQTSRNRYLPTVCLLLTLLLTPAVAAAATFCPEGGERYTGNEKFCPEHGVQLRPLAATVPDEPASASGADDLAAAKQTCEQVIRQLGSSSAEQRIVFYQACTQAVASAPSTDFILSMMAVAWMAEPQVVGDKVLRGPPYENLWRDSQTFLDLSGLDNETKAGIHLFRAFYLRESAEKAFLAGAKLKGLTLIEQAYDELGTAIWLDQKTAMLQKIREIFQATLAGFKAAAVADIDPDAAFKNAKRLLEQGAFPEALTDLYAAALNHHRAAQSELGLFFRYKLGKADLFDYPLAVKWLKLAEQGGNADAIARLGIMYKQGYYYPKNVDEAFRRFQEAARKGSDNGTVQLGICYRDGVGVEKDETKAFELIRGSAIKTGNRAVQRLVGDLYRDGRGTAKDVETAVSWYRKAAEQGDKGAQKRLEELGEIGEVTASRPEPARVKSTSATTPSETGGRYEVIEVLNSAGYTFLHVYNGARKGWIATPEVTISVGDIITHNPGMQMPNYESKSLGRTFAMIEFVDSVKIAKR